MLDGEKSMSLGKLPHSHSTPIGVMEGGGGGGGVGGGSLSHSNTASQQQLKKAGGKMLAVRVQMLDDSVTMFQIQAKAVGRVLFDQVCKQLHLLEADYFGLEYQDVAGTRYWVDLEKPVARQVGLSLVDPLLRFCVKFYTPDPAQLEEEFTRYLFCLQVKRDLSHGHIQCNDNTAALMASYIVQAECGDYVAEDYPDPSYLSVYKFVPHQDLELERRIMENHKKHVGQSPAEADLNLLETARRCELYGMKMHPAKDHEGVPLNLSVAHMGIVVFQNYTKINTFSWAKIRKISFKRKRFLIKLHPEGYGYYKDTVEFFFEGRNECKNFWKKCVENHGFFRCSIVKKVPRQRTRVLSRGSSFRYSGKTQKQIVEFVRENYVKRQTFQRSQSFRHSSSVHSSVGMNVGGSLSAHPLLPLGDSSAVSLSCGSMSLAGMAVGRGVVGASPSPTVRRATRTNRAATAVEREIQSERDNNTEEDNTTPSHSHATITITQGQINTTYQHHRKPSSTSSSQQQLYFDYDDSDDRQSYCRHCGEELESITSSRRSSRSRREMSPVSRTRSSQTDIIAIDYGDNDDNEPAAAVRHHEVDDDDAPKSVIIESTTQDPRTYHWQRSSSCKELDRGPIRSMDIPRPLAQPLDEPITRYDDTRRSCYSVAGSKTPSLDRSNVDAPETKVYSSSYPGTTSSLSTESGGGDECGPSLEVGGSVLIIDTGSSHEEMVLSHDDLSHDSYELLEREHCELYGGESHSLSIDSAGEQLPDDEMFVMDDDFDSKDNSDVEKRLGYVEPRYADMGFNEFNEKCKQEIAHKRAVEFHEFDAKCKPGMVIGFDSEAASTLTHFPVERTKSDPYVSDFWKVAKQHRRLLHQKSIDLTPTESSVDSGGTDEYNKSTPGTSKSVIDIPYTLHKRHHLDMYTSERPHEVVARSPQHISPKTLSPIYVRKSPEKSPDVVRKTAKSPKKVSSDNSDRLSKTKTKPDLNSQDSGLSLSLGTESVDDLQEVLSRNIDNIDNIVGIEFEGKGDEVERKIIKEKVDSRQNSRQSSFENVEMDTLKVDDERYKAGKSAGKKEHFVKGKSEESTRRKGTLSKVRHVHSADGGMRRDTSFDKRDAVQVIKIDSDSSQDVCSCGSDRKETRRRDIKSSSLDSSDPDVIIVEYRGNRKKAFQKRASSGSKDSTDKERDVRRGSSLDLPKSGSKDSKRSEKQSKDLKQEFKDSKKKSSKLDRNKLSKEDSREKQKSSKTERDAKHAERMLKKEDSLEGYDKVLSDDNLEKPKTESVTSIEDESTAIGIPVKHKSHTRTVVVSIEKEDNEVVIVEEPTELQKRKEMLKEIPLVKNEEDTTKKTVTTPTKKPVVSPETTWKKFGELPAPISHKRERSPILFARLGLSEGSTFAPNYRQASVVSPSSSRRAKSLDAPVVSLHRLPPVTSFSSKDDTLEDDEDEFEEKTHRHGLQLLKDSLRREENQIEEEQLEEIADSVEVCVESIHCEDSKHVKNDKPKVIENIHRPMEDLTAIGNSSGSSVELPEEPVEEIQSNDEALGGIEKEAGKEDDISVTLEKLDEVVDRVKDNKFTNKKGTKVDNLVLDSSELKEGLSPCLSPNTDTKSPCLSPKDLPPRSPCLSPNDPPHSPCRVPAGEPSPCAERRPSTRKERLDSFKNTKSYSVDIWTSEETDVPGIPTLDVDDINIDFTSNDYDDETFITEPENPDESEKLKDINIKVIETVIKTTEEVIKVMESVSRRSTVDEEIYEKEVGENKSAEVISTEDECWESTEEMPNASEKNVTTTDGEETEEDNKIVVDKIDEEEKVEEVILKNSEGDEEKKKKMLSEMNLSSSTEKVRETLKESLQLEVIEPLDEPSTSGIRFIPEKRSFDEEPSSSSSKSVKPELSSTWKPFPLESSGSSSLEEGIFPPDDTGHYADEEEGSSHSNNGPDDFPTGFGYPMTGAEMIISGYTGGMFGLSRTLSRISERSTTSEQERSDDFEDDISTKPSSRSLSVDDESLLSSDRQPSLSSDPPSATDIPFEDRALPDLPPLPPEPRRSSSLLRRPLPLTQEEEWPSPPDSDSPFDTPVISHVETFYMEIKPEEATKVVVGDSKEVDPDNGESSTDENKTLQEETTTQSMIDESEGTVKLAVRPKSRFGGNSVSEDTSVGVCADFSSSSGTGTGTTVKHCQYYSCTVKSDDNSSLAGDFGLSLSTEMISSRKSSDDATEKFHTKPSGLYLPQRSFDDYDSPCTDSDDGQAAALISPTRTTLKRRLQQSPSHQFIGQRSGSVPLSPTGVTGIKKFMEHRSKHRLGMKCTPYYSAPVPVSHEIRDVSEAIDRRGGSGGGSSRSIARSKCYSYYSLARDPPSDGSSSSLDNQDPPTAPNTIPRVSKKRRHHSNQLKRYRHRVSVDMEVRDGHIVSVSSPSVIVACGGQDNSRQQQSQRKNDNNRATTTQQQQQLTKQSSV